MTPEQQHDIRNGVMVIYHAVRVLARSGNLDPGQVRVVGKIRQECLRIGLSVGMTGLAVARSRPERPRRKRMFNWRPKLVENWRSAWRWFSIHAMFVTASLQLAWVELPPDVRMGLPPHVISYASIALLVLGIIGRLIRQEPGGDITEVRR